MQPSAYEGTGPELESRNQEWRGGDELGEI